MMKTNKKCEFDPSQQTITAIKELCPARNTNLLQKRSDDLAGENKGLQQLTDNGPQEAAAIQSEVSSKEAEKVHELAADFVKHADMGHDKLQTMAQGIDSSRIGETLAHTASKASNHLSATTKFGTDDPKGGGESCSIPAVSGELTAKDEREWLKFRRNTSASCDNISLRHIFDSAKRDCKTAEEIVATQGWLVHQDLEEYYVAQRGKAEQKWVEVDTQAMHIGDMKREVEQLEQEQAKLVEDAYMANRTAARNILYKTNATIENKWEVDIQRLDISEALRIVKETLDMFRGLPSQRIISFIVGPEGEELRTSVVACLQSYSYREQDNCIQVLMDDPTSYPECERFFRTY